MDPQNQGSRFESPASGPAYPPQAYAHHQAVAGGQPDIVKRGGAALIDFVIIGFAVGVLNVILAIALGRFGMMAAAGVGVAAVLLRDVAFGGRSLGKKLLGLNAVNATGGPITPEQSIKRNITLSIGMLGSVVAPIPVIGLLAFVFYLAGFAASAYELFLVATGKPRLGDQIAGTHVVVEGQPAVAL